MAKKTKSKEPSKIQELWHNQNFRAATAILLFIAAIYLSIVFTSYLFSGNADQSLKDIPLVESIENSNIKAQNEGGKTGAYISNLFINEGFGIASYIFIYLLIILTLQTIKRPIVKLWRNLFLGLLGILWLSTMLGLILPTGKDLLNLSGNSGLYIANWMESMFGFVGTLLLMFAILTITIVFAFEQFIPWVSELKHKIFPIREPEDNEEDLEEYDENWDDEEDWDNDIILDDASDSEEDKLEIKVVDEDQTDNGNEVELLVLANKTTAEATEPERKTNIERKAIEEDEQDEEELGLIVEKAKEDEKVDGNSSHGNLDQDYDPTLDLSNYKFPSIDLLDDHQGKKVDVSPEELNENKDKIVETLSHYKIDIVKIRATIGPTITLYEIVPAPGTRVNKIKNLEDDIALSLAALGVRIIAPMPGKGTIGIEVPNKVPEIVSMRSIVASKKFQESKAELPVVMGKTITNETFVFDLAKMPHLLVAGATGQGKSVGLNAIITSLLYKKHPSQLKMVMVDPKMVELNIYGVIEKHFLAQLPDADKPIITDVDKVKNTLNSLTIEMDERYKLLMKANARNIKEYNVKFIARKLNPLNGHKYLPYIVMVVDEFADLIMTAGKEIETPIARIAQKARAVGMHMIIATQRPSTNIITGVIKANFPGRVAFRVASMIDSRTILDSPGANQLIGKGDMLFMQGSDMTRLQCAFVDTPEVERICAHIADQQGYPTPFMLPEYTPEDEGGMLEVDMKQRDELFDDVARMVVANQMGSTSWIQRKYGIGYNRAGRIMDQLEAAGIVGSSQGSKAREVLVQDDYALEQLINDL